MRMVHEPTGMCVMRLVLQAQILRSLRIEHPAQPKEACTAITTWFTNAFEIENGRLQNGTSYWVCSNIDATIGTSLERQKFSTHRSTKCHASSFPSPGSSNTRLPAHSSFQNRCLTWARVLFRRFLSCPRKSASRSSILRNEIPDTAQGSILSALLRSFLPEVWIRRGEAISLLLIGVSHSSRWIAGMTETPWHQWMLL